MSLFRLDYLPIARLWRLTKGSGDGIVLALPAKRVGGG
jgi:hypothetical protein